MYAVNNTDGATAILHDMLIEFQGAKELLMSETVWLGGAGRPPANNIVSSNFVGGLPGDLRGLKAQQGQKDGVIAIRLSVFNEWLIKNGYEPTLIRQMLTGAYRVDTRKMSLGAGLGIAGAFQTMCLTLVPSRSPSSPSSNLGSP